MFGALFAPVPPPDGALLDLAREFTPRVQSLAPGEALLDLHGLGRVWPTPRTSRVRCSPPPTPADGATCALPWPGRAWPLSSPPAAATG